MAVQTIQTPFGPIRKATGCKDDYENLEVYDQPGAGSVIVLQAPAVRSLQDAEEAVYRKMHPILAARRKRKDRRPGRELITVLAGSKRTCELQAILYRRDPNRYASPNTTLHTHGLAIDVSQAQGARKLRHIHHALMMRGWHQSRPDDEPWHYSYRLTA